MKSLVELILENKIDELSIKNKDVYASGVDHKIYQNLKDPNKLFKVKSPKYDEPGSDVDWISLFDKYPQYFPKIYRRNEKGAEVEKLDALKAKKEFLDMSSLLHDIDGSLQGLFNMIGSNIEKEKTQKYVKEYFDHLKENNPELASKFLKWIKLISDISKISGLDRLDIHANNFGYDKQGKLKMIDI